MQFPMRNQRLFPVLGFIFLLFAYHLIFYRYFPTGQGKLGHDYAYFLPQLLNGVYWFRNNGIFVIPWFTPGFCGGVPFFPNPQNIYYSLPQLLSFIFNPVAGVYLSVLIFAALGFMGAFQLLRRVFSVSNIAAFLGSTLFLFNGFYISRMMIGHLTYQVFALVPLLAWVLLSKTDSGDRQHSNELIRSVIAGIILAYMFYAGAANFLVPITIMLVCIWSLLGLVSRYENRFWKRLWFSVMISLLVSAAKLYPGILYMHEFSRDFNPLPGFEGIWNAAVNVFRMLFLTFDSDMPGKLTNFPYPLEQNEFEYGMTVVPLVLMIIFPVILIKSFIHSRPDLHISGKKISYLVVFISVLFIPIIFNAHYPAWSSFLKKLPYIENSTNLIRWGAIYIPVLTIISSIATDLIKQPHFKVVLSAVCIAYLLFFNYISDRSYYKTQNYDPGNIIESWHSEIQPVTFNDNLPGSEREIDYLNRNDLMTIGGSQLRCYEPLFGYGLEYFPGGNLRKGSVFEIDNGDYNFKNPACYIFPEQNQCMPGDHFSELEPDKLKQFTSYKPFSFQMSKLQKLFNFVSVLTTILLTMVLLLIGFMRVKRLLEKRG